MVERRYSEDEVREILRAAASSGSAPDRPAPSGLTLAELTTIGEEVGIPADRITQAAAHVGAGDEQSRSRILGLPFAVGLTVDLPRSPTRREWKVLVAEIRETFRAQGKESSSDEFRSWRNGNLHIAIEPTESGQRLRMTTRKSDARMSLLLGLFFLAFGLLFFIVAEGETLGRYLPLLFTSWAAGLISYNVIRLPRWASEREGQMRHIAERAQQLLASSTRGSPPPGSG